MLRRATRLRAAGGIAAIVTLGAMATPRIGRAQERARNASLFHRSVPAPSRALEVGIAGGYDQGVGALGGIVRPNVQDIAGVGAGAEISAGYRFSPRLSLGAVASGALYTTVTPDANAKSASAGARATWHFRPYRSVDPWIAFGVGYRVFWDSLPGQDATVRKALQLAQLGIGVDYRLSPEFGLGPFITGDLSYFFQETLPGRPSMSVSALSTFVAAGISARFDFLGEALHPAYDVATR